VGFCKAKRLVEARVLFEVMKGGDFRPNLVTYSVLIDCYCKSGEVGEGFSLLEEMEREGLKADVFVHSSLISAFCGEGDVEKGRELFDEMLMRKEGEEPGTLTYNVVVNGLCKEDRVDDALRVVEMMAKKGKKPDVVTYNTLLKGLCGAAKIDEAMELWKLLLSEKFHVKLDVFTFNNLIQGLCKEGRVHDAAMIHYSMVEMWLQDVDVVFFNIIIDGTLKAGMLNLPRFSKLGMLYEAMALYEKMVSCGHVPDVVVFDSLLKGYGLKGETEKIISLLHQMADKDVVPDSKLTSTILACLCHMSRDLDVETILPKLSQQSEHTSKGATIKCHELLMKPNNVHPELKLYVAQ
ncbi:Pentatricopeptide repeat-containing protein, partial [Glycine soja]